LVQKKPAAGGGNPLNEDSASRVRRAIRGGQPLDAGSRAFFEPRLQRDLSSVRIHTGQEADSAAREIGAEAFTLGRDIVFAEDRYAPRRADGRALLAHELAHVAQQHDSVRRTIHRKPSATKNKIVLLVGGEASVTRSWQNFFKATKLRLEKMAPGPNDEVVVIVYTKPYNDRKAASKVPEGDPKDYLKAFETMLTETGKKFTLVKAPTEADIYTSLKSLPTGSITRLEYFGHGLVGKLAIGYDYDDSTIDPAIDVADLSKLDKTRFAKDSVFVSWACNTATKDSSGNTFSLKYQKHIGGVAVGPSTKTDYSHVAHSSWAILSEDKLPFITDKRYPKGQWQLAGSKKALLDQKITQTAVLKNKFQVTARSVQDSNGFQIDSPKTALVEITNIQVNGAGLKKYDRLGVCLYKDNLIIDSAAGCQIFRPQSDETKGSDRTLLFAVSDKGTHYVTVSFSRPLSGSHTLTYDLKVFEV